MKNDLRFLSSGLLLACLWACALGQAAEIAPLPRPLTTRTFLTNCGYVELPSTTSRRTYHRFVDVDLQSQQFKFCIDTGAIYSYVDPSIASPLKLSPSRPTIPKRGPNDAFPTWKIDLSAGSISLKNVRLVDLECRPLLEQISGINRPGGIFGVDILNRQQMVLDYQAGPIFASLAERPNSLVGACREAIRCGQFAEVIRASGRIEGTIRKGRTSGRWYLEVKLNDRQCLMLLDSGAATNLLFSKTAKRMGYELQSRSEKLVQCQVWILG